jgi:L-alanine-DL-glutamate epimerase-like enolase superfamily enzyme
MGRGAARFRRWAFESAALDLTLRQAGHSLHDVLGLEPEPVRFVNSLGLGKEPSIEPLRRRLARSPGVRFKLDAEATWPPALVDEVAATGAVDTIDFKGQYGLEVKDPEALGALYNHVLSAFPDAYLEDPHDLPEIAQRLGDQLERVSYDAPIRSADDIGATPLAARAVNVKPSRIGSLRELFEIYARCARDQRPMYGGGMAELGVGRGQIELLAALFHADAPNDVAPSGYNEEHPPGDLPASPLTPRPEATGFRWTA